MMAIPLAVLVGACAASHAPLETVGHVDIDRFMGDWYVIAHIPTPLEDEAYNAVERYSLNQDGTIATTFTFNEGGFNGERRRYTPTGFVLDRQSNAVWGMRFVWPIKADYRVIFLDEDYSTTVIGRSKRDYVWLMARKPDISADKLKQTTEVIEQAGYDLARLRMVPQQW